MYFTAMVFEKETLYIFRCSSYRRYLLFCALFCRRNFEICLRAV